MIYVEIIKKIQIKYYLTQRELVSLKERIYLIEPKKKRDSLRIFKKYSGRDFTGDPVVRNPPVNAGDMGLIPGQGSGSCMLQLKDTVCPNKLKNIY